MIVEIVPGVPGREVERQGRVAERQLLTIGHDQVALRPRLTLVAAVEQIPVGRRHHHVRLGAVLKELRAAGMIEVAVADDDVLDVRRIESELLQPADHFVLDRVVEDRVDDDDAGGRHDRPRRVFGLPDEIEVVEHFGRLRVPQLASGPLAGRATPSAARGRGAARAPATGGSRVRRRRLRTGRAQERRKVLARRSFRGSSMRGSRVGRCAPYDDHGAETDGDDAGSDQVRHMRFHRGTPAATMRAVHHVRGLYA